MSQGLLKGNACSMPAIGSQKVSKPHFRMVLPGSSVSASDGEGFVWRALPMFWNQVLPWNFGRLFSCLESGITPVPSETVALLFLICTLTAFVRCCRWAGWLWKEGKLNGYANSLPFPPSSLIHILVKGKWGKCWVESSGVLNFVNRLIWSPLK